MYKKLQKAVLLSVFITSSLRLLTAYLFYLFFVHSRLCSLHFTNSHSPHISHFSGFRSHTSHLFCIGFFLLCLSLHTPPLSLLSPLSALCATFSLCAHLCVTLVALFSFISFSLSLRTLLGTL